MDTKTYKNHPQTLLLELYTETNYNGIIFMAQTEPPGNNNRITSIVALSFMMF